jgi:Zn-dependent peptidase ImmA (M78 family)
MGKGDVMYLLRTRVITNMVAGLLKALNLQPPITARDLEKIAALLGTKIIRVRLDKCQGFTYHQDSIYYVFINENLPPRTAQFVVAHELGHIVLDHCLQPVSTVSPDVLEALEAEADIFAARLLNPEKAEPDHPADTAPYPANLASF